MTAKEYFVRVNAAERKIKILVAKLNHFEDLARTITSNTSALGGHQAGTSRVEQAAVGIVDATTRLRAEIEKYSAIITDAEKLIEQIPQERYRDILTLRYLCNWSFRSISDECHYQDPKSVYRAHGWALIEAQKILREQEKTADPEAS